MAHLARWLAARRGAILSRSLLRLENLHGHNVRHVQNLLGALPAIPSGVVLVQAPMGAGKTQLIGAPLVSRARELGQSVLAVCHRVTLVSELSSRLGLAHYQGTKSDEIQTAGGMAVCLPSIKRHDVIYSVGLPEVVFIDEIRQVIDFLAEDECFNVRDASAQAVFDHLCEVIRRARIVIGADAHLNDRTVKFLERCRPGEAFTVLVMPPTTRSGTVQFCYGSIKNVRSRMMDAALSELVAGGKVWVSCESKNFAEACHGYLKDQGFRSILITAMSKVERDQAAFLANADAESRKYDVVVSSPAVTSGLSIEHKDAPHFTLGIFLGSGHAVLPTDAVQQIGRVRYLERLMVGVTANNLQGRVDPDAILSGRIGALEVQGTPAVPDDYARFASVVSAEGINARADFASALYWLLEASGWSLEVVSVEPGSQAAEIARLLAIQEKLQLLNATPVETDGAVARELDRIKSMLRGDPERASQLKAQIPALERRLEAARIRVTLGIFEIWEEDWRLWDNGRLLKKVEFFESLVAAKAPHRPVMPIASFMLTWLGRARWYLYRDLFDGFDIWSDGWLTQEVAEQILDRVMARPEVFAAVGIVGQKFYSRASGKSQGNSGPDRPRSAVKAVGEILGRAGLALRARQQRVSQMGPVSVNTKGAIRDSDRVRVYSTSGLVQLSDLLRLKELARHPTAAYDTDMKRFVSLRQLRRSMAELLSWAQAATQVRLETDEPDCELWQ